MPDAAHEVTLGEVYRLALRIDSRFDQLTREMVGRQEYESDHESIDRRISDLATALADERREREQGDERIVTKADSAKKWAIGIAVSVAVPLLTLGIFVFNLGRSVT